MQNPPLTVLLTVYNGMPYLPETVESILQQTLPAFTFLIINNASTDGSAKFLASLTDTRIRLLSPTKLMSRTAVLNYGLDQITSPFTAIIDADDLAEPIRLADQLDFLLKNPHISLLGSDVTYIDTHNTPVGEDLFPIEHESLCSRLPLYNQFAHAACMFRTNCAKELGGYPATFHYAQDFALWLLLFQHSKRSASLPKKLARIRKHTGQMSQNEKQKTIRLEEDVQLCHMLLTLNYLPLATRQAAYVRLAFVLWKLQKKKESIRALAKSFLMNPLLFFANPLLQTRFLLWRKNK